MPPTPSEQLDQIRAISVDDYNALATLIADVYSRRSARVAAREHPLTLTLVCNHQERTER